MHVIQQKRKRNYPLTENILIPLTETKMEAKKIRKTETKLKRKKSNEKRNWNWKIFRNL